MSEGYRTLARPGEAVYESKRSRFLGYAAPVQTPEQAAAILEEIRKRHFDARHHCYAYILGEAGGQQKYADDGEPQGTAGMPILEVIRKQALTNALVVVTRYFGGTLLGAGGLVRAYTQAAVDAIGNAGICVVSQAMRLSVACGYDMWPRVEHALSKQDVLLEDTAFSERVTVTLLIKAADQQGLQARLVDLTNGAVHILQQGLTYAAWPQETR